MSGIDEELEVKFYLSRSKALEEKLFALGARLSEPRAHEINLRFDTSDQALAVTGRLLRLRMDTRARLTYKGPGRIEGGARLRQELEITVSDFKTARELLEALGYQVKMMYEKFRTTYHLGDLEVVLDEMPYGDFVEIEGMDGKSIQDVAEQLGLDWETRILDSYTILFDHVRNVFHYGFRDLSFKNFKGKRIKPEDLGVGIADER